MTTFDALEISREGSRPVEVFAFALGAEEFLYTSAEDTLTVDSDEYTATAIARSEIVQGIDEAQRTLSITVPGTNEFARRYIETVPSERATVSIIRLQRDESPTFDTQVLIYKGGIQSVSFTDDGSTAIIAVRSIQASLSRSIPRFTYMGMCNHVLYDSGCKVNSLDFQTTGAVTGVDGNIVTVSGASGQPDQYYRGGFAKTITSPVEFRLILSHEGDDLRLLLPFGTNLTSASLQIFAGCDHTFSDCGTKFDQVPEYGGFGFVPGKNPFDTGLL